MLQRASRFKWPTLIAVGSTPKRFAANASISVSGIHGAPEIRIDIAWEDVFRLHGKEGLGVSSKLGSSLLG